MFYDLSFISAFALTYLLYRSCKNSYLASVSLRNLEDEEFEQLKRNLEDIAGSWWSLYCYLVIAFLCHFIIDFF